MTTAVGPVQTSNIEAWLAQYFRANNIATWHETSHAIVWGERGQMYRRVDIETGDGRSYTVWFDLKDVVSLAPAGQIVSNTGNAATSTYGVGSLFAAIGLGLLGGLLFGGEKHRAATPNPSVRQLRAEAYTRALGHEPKPEPVLAALIASPRRATAEKFSRRQLIHALQANDPNGVYTDSAAKREGFPPLTKHEALKLLTEQLGISR